MDKVYLLIWDDKFNGYDFPTIFSTRAKARAYVRKHPDCSWTDYKIFEVIVNSTKTDPIEHSLK